MTSLTIETINSIFSGNPNSGVVPIGTIQAYIVMLHGNVLLKQGLRPCKTVDGCVFFHSHLRHPPTTLTIPMPSAISIAHSSPLDSVIRTGQHTLRYTLDCSARILLALLVSTFTAGGDCIRMQTKHADLVTTMWRIQSGLLLSVPAVGAIAFCVQHASETSPMDRIHLLYVR